MYSSESVAWQPFSRLSRLSQSMVRQVCRSYAQRLTPGTIIIFIALVWEIFGPYEIILVTSRVLAISTSLPVSTCRVRRFRNSIPRTRTSLEDLTYRPTHNNVSCFYRFRHIYRRSTNCQFSCILLVSPYTRNGKLNQGQCRRFQRMWWWRGLISPMTTCTLQRRTHMQAGLSLSLLLVRSSVR